MWESTGLITLKRSRVYSLKRLLGYGRCSSIPNGFQGHFSNAMAHDFAEKSSLKAAAACFNDKNVAACFGLRRTGDHARIF